MKFVIILLICVMSCIGCGESLRVNGVEYDTVGLATQDTKHPCLKYNLIVGNLIWGIVFSESIIAPVYFFGWSLWEPTKERYPGCIVNYNKYGKKALPGESI